MCDGGGNPTTDGGELIDLLAAVDRLRESPPAECSAEEVGEQLIQLRYACDLLELEFATRAARFAATDEYEAQGSVSPVAWIRHQCRMGGGAAVSAVCVGEQAGHLPRSTEALVAGRIGFGHLALLASASQALGESPTGGGFDEEPLLRQALKHTVSRFRHDCAHARHAADAKGFLAEQTDAVEARRLELFPCEGGALIVRGILDPAGGATLRTALEPLAARSGADDHRDRERRLADALVELASHSLDHGLLPPRRGQRTHLQVTAALETLLGLAGAPAGELEFASPIAASTVQRLACDATVTRVLLGPDSAVIDVGRARRVPAASTRVALELRDRGCAWPGCDRPATWTEAHHLRHWAHGGTTDLPNLALLCHRHHWMVHEGGWQLVRTDDQRLLTIPPLPDPLPHARAPDLTAAA